MSAVERLKESLNQDRQAKARANRIALEDSLRQVIPAEVYREITFEYSDDGNHATLRVDGHKPIRALMHILNGGVDWEVRYAVGGIERHERLVITPSLAEALEAASLEA